MKRKHPGYTEFAGKYTARRKPGVDDALIGFEPEKSGMTSLEPGPFATLQETFDYSVLENYQKLRFEGLNGPFLLAQF